MTKDQALELMASRERMKEIIPELLALEDCPQQGPYHTEGDVLTHTRIVVSNLFDQAEPPLVWAALLHDIAKPLTISERERDGEVVNQFFKHEVVGTDLTEQIMSRLKVSTDQILHSKWLVRNHMRIAALPEMREKKARDFVRHKFFSDLFQLFEADVRGSISRTEEMRLKKEELIRNVEYIFHHYS